MAWSDPLAPDAALLCKLGSVAVHVEEILDLISDDPDKAAIEALLFDPDVREWLTLMTEAALLPVRRGA